ncbi:hypothetical protein [Actinacidiphila oryziradicis]|jgi:hypothetical protein|uniref:Uncharacterized protein n=1 Tax=Actinacidiphila oryziradicis TaxID=2571141 RepID=A0A4V5MZQ5_9ACTN|nr:hypothetical protein [Actinacidiphila oryziradicis]TKA09119.1 hypothetical protein FCI23_23795 [Actinacidiphila oryziradicis]
MPLHIPPAPSAALRSVLAALSSPATVREARTPALREAVGPLVPDHPLPMHVLEPTAPGGGLPHARLTGWRFHIRSDERVAAAGETVPTADGWAFSHFCEGPYLASTERALRQADVLTAGYQPHLLSVPGLYMLTLWLHSDLTDDPAVAQPASADLLIPLAPAPPGIAAHRLHRLTDLVPVLTLRLAPTPLLSSPA